MGRCRLGWWFTWKMRKLESWKTVVINKYVIWKMEGHSESRTRSPFGWFSIFLYPTSKKWHSNTTSFKADIIYIFMDHLSSYHWVLLFPIFSLPSMISISLYMVISQSITILVFVWERDASPIYHKNMYKWSWILITLLNHRYPSSTQPPPRGTEAHTK